MPVDTKRITEREEDAVGKKGESRLSFDKRLSIKPALTYFRPRGLSSARESSLLSSEWDQVFPSRYGRRHGAT